MKNMEADVIVVAAGPAGLAAAITAGENDLKTIVFEKANTTGGAANMGMGPLGIGTKIQIPLNGWKIWVLSLPAHSVILPNLRLPGIS